MAKKRKTKTKSAAKKTARRRPSAGRRSKLAATSRSSASLDVDDRVKRAGGCRIAVSVKQPLSATPASVDDRGRRRDRGTRFTRSSRKARRAECEGRRVRTSPAATAASSDFSNLADALRYFRGARRRQTGLRRFALEPGVAGAPVLRPSLALFDLAGLLGFAPFLSALPLTLTRRLLARGQLALLFLGLVLVALPLSALSALALAVASASAWSETWLEMAAGIDDECSRDERGTDQPNHGRLPS